MKDERVSTLMLRWINTGNPSTCVMSYVSIERYFDRHIRGINNAPFKAVDTVKSERKYCDTIIRFVIALIRTDTAAPYRLVIGDDLSPKVQAVRDQPCVATVHALLRALSAECALDGDGRAPEAL